MTADQPVADLWAQVVGQPDAVARLRRAVGSPTHAYLLVGPEGSGTREAARAFAADLLCDGLAGDAAVRARRQVALESHPCLTVVERIGASIDVEQLKDVVLRANMTPPEGDRQVIVLVDVHLVTNVPILLKTLEEPPASTVFVLLSEEVTPDMSTVASRCVEVEFSPVPEAQIIQHLVAEGIEPELAGVAAAGSGGSLSQARLLVDDPSASARRKLWYDLPERLDGSGATVAALVEEVMAATALLADPLTQRQKAELAELDRRVEMTGSRSAGERKALADRHKREQRRVRTADLRAGLAALVSGYRDRLAVDGLAEDFLAAAGSVQEVLERMVFNPNVELQLQALLTELPRRPGV